MFGESMKPGDPALGHSHPDEVAGGQHVASGDGLATAFTFAHGLAAAPTSVLVTAGSAAARGDFDVTFDANNVTVTFAAAPATGANNVVLNWLALI